jgi:hypothetical protein
MAAERPVQCFLKWLVWVARCGAHGRGWSWRRGVHRLAICSACSSAGGEVSAPGEFSVATYHEVLLVPRLQAGWAGWCMVRVNVEGEGGCGGPVADLPIVAEDWSSGGPAIRPKAMIEPVFAQTKHNRRISQFQRRGRSAARSEWRLITATHNLMKLHKHQVAAQGACEGTPGRSAGRSTLLAATPLTTTARGLVGSHPPPPGSRDTHDEKEEPSRRRGCACRVRASERLPVGLARMFAQPSARVRCEMNEASGLGRARKCREQELALIGQDK